MADPSAKYASLAILIFNVLSMIICTAIMPKIGFLHHRDEVKLFILEVKLEFFLLINWFLGLVRLASQDKDRLTRIEAKIGDCRDAHEEGKNRVKQRERKAEQARKTGERSNVGDENSDQSEITGAEGFGWKDRMISADTLVVALIGLAEAQNLL